MVLKAVFSVMSDWNVVLDPEFFMLLHTISHISGAKNISKCAIFYTLSTFGFKTEASFNEKISFMRSGERRCEIF